MISLMMEVAVLGPMITPVMIAGVNKTVGKVVMNDGEECEVWMTVRGACAGWMQDIHVLDGHES